MKKTSLILVALFAASGCSSENLFYQHENTVTTPDASGVEFVAEDVAQVGMSGTTCDVTIEDGAIGTDYDYPGDNDRVVDSGPDPVTGSDVVVVTSDKGVHIQEGSDFWGATSIDYDVPAGVVDATLTDDAVVVLTEDCEVGFVHGDDPTGVGVMPEFCEGTTEITANPETGDAWIGSENGLVLVDPKGDAELVDEAPSEIVAWDAESDCLYTAARGSDTVYALEADGSIRWVSDVRGEVLDIAEGDNGGRAIVAIASGMGGEIVQLDGYTGLELGSKSVNTRPDAITTANGGRSLAVAGSNRVDFYNASMLSF